MGAAQKSTHLRVRRLPPADLGEDDPARQQAAAHRLVLGRLPDGDPLQRHLCPAAPETARIGSYRSAWLLAHKLRASMVDPERNPLSGLVEIDRPAFHSGPKTILPPEGKDAAGKMLIVGAIELGDGNIPGRLRLAEISSYGAADLGHFVETAAIPTIAKTDGCGLYGGLASTMPRITEVIARWRRTSRELRQGVCGCPRASRTSLPPPACGRPSTCRLFRSFVLPIISRMSGLGSGESPMLFGDQL